MIRILILIVVLSLVAPPSLADNPASGSIVAELLEYRFTDGVALLDTEGEYGTPTNRAVLKLVTLSGRGETEAAAALLYRRAMSDRFDLQAGVEFSGDTNTYVLGFQAQAPHNVSTELVTLLDETGHGYLIGKIERIWKLSGRLELWPRLEVIVAFQEDEANTTGAGPSTALADLRLRYELYPRLMPYVGVSLARAIGDTNKMLEAAGEDTASITVVAGASFAF